MSKAYHRQKQCLVCGQKIEEEDDCFPLFAYRNHPLCGYCQQKLIPSKKKHVLYEYNDFFRSLLFAYKAMGDLALAPVFLAGKEKALRRKYRHYVIVYAPSFAADDRKRGFISLPWIFRSLRLPIVSLFEKTSPYKQATSKQRKKIFEVIALKQPMDLSGQKVLLVDDVMTSGYTLTACQTWLQSLQAKQIDYLVLASKTKKKKGKEIKHERKSQKIFSR